MPETHGEPHLLIFPCCFPHARQPLDTLYPALCRERVRLMSVLLDQRSSLLTLRRQSPVFVLVIHRYYTAVRLLEDVHAGSTALAFSRRPMVSFDHRYLRGLPVLAHEVYRRALGSSTTQDCPGTRAIVPVHVAFRTRQWRRHPDCIFSELNNPARLSPVYASPYSSRSTAQNSGPSGSLVLSRKALSSSASCRFIPAHCLSGFHPRPQDVGCCHSPE